MSPRMNIVCLAALLTVLEVACSNNKEGEITQRFQRVMDMTADIVEVNFNDSDQLDIRSIRLLENDSVDESRFGIRLEFSTESFVRSQSIPRKEFHFVNEAFATPPVPSPLASEFITEIKVYCNKMFGENYPPGTNIANLFDVIARPPVHFSSHAPTNRLSVHDFLLESPEIVEELVLLLNSPVESGNDYAFTIKYYQSAVANFDPKIDSLQVTTKEVWINKE